ncbi:MAG TPA: methyltransferase domain-containing protein [Gemmatimonadaceae bacterium]|nr:methyltransferase domain-containing protein [Gemmatimonadaceae bacterium]
MLAALAPRRRRGAELLDDPDVNAAVRTRSLGDVARANALFGGAHAVLAELGLALARLPAARASLLDVGTGLGDIPRRAQALAARRGVALSAVGVDLAEALARAASGDGFAVACADARALPFPDASVDFVTCSQLLHHFDGEEARALLRELHRVARRLVIVSELRRSWPAAAGIWLASWPLRFHPVSRHDGVLSVLRGFRRGELGTLVRDAVAREAVVRDRVGFRTTAVWAP